MSLLSFFESLFCGECKEKVEDLTEDKRILTRNYQNLNDEYLHLAQSTTEDILVLHEQIQTLNNLLSTSIPIPDISSHIDSPKMFAPYQTPIGIPMGLIADEFYYTFTLPQWIEILTLIQKEVEEHALINGWVTDISDCDDFAVVLNGHAVTTFVHSGLDKQGCLLYVRSKTHAYNVFVAHDGDEFTPYVYEPQTNKVVGKLSEVNWEPYVTTEGWLLGAELPPH